MDEHIIATMQVEFVKLSTGKVDVRVRTHRFAGDVFEVSDEQHELIEKEISKLQNYRKFRFEQRRAKDTIDSMPSDV